MSFLHGFRSGPRARARFWCRIRGTLLLATVATLGVFPAGCDDGESETTSIVIGVVSDFRAGTDLTSLDVVMTVDGRDVGNQALGLGPDATMFPTEFAFDDVPVGASVAITLRGSLGRSLVVVRRLETTTQAGPRRFLPMRLERACQRVDDGIGSPGPICDEPATTCINGACASPEVSAGQQVTYDPDWPNQGDDPCQAGGDPELTVGQGQSDYFVAEDREVAQVEAGPQGGHHIWIAARARNVNRSGTRTTVAAELPDLGLSISPLSVIFTLDRGEGGFCKLAGLRLQLDIDGDPIDTMLGEEVTVMVTMADSDDNVATDTHRFTLSDDIL
ncbi:MAG: hypothetical protein AAGN82_04030 [Myxococcota bacterium]